MVWYHVWASASRRGTCVNRDKHISIRNHIPPEASLPFRYTSAGALGRSAPDPPNDGPLVVSVSAFCTVCSGLILIALHDHIYSIFEQAEKGLHKIGVSRAWGQFNFRDDELRDVLAWVPHGSRTR